MLQGFKIFKTNLLILGQGLHWLWI